MQLKTKVIMYLQDYTTYCAEPTKPTEQQFELTRTGNIANEKVLIELAQRKDLYNEPGVLVLPYALDSSIEDP